MTAELRRVVAAFGVEDSDSVAFVLAASLSGPEREASMRLLAEVNDALPAKRPRSVFFLGNPLAYEAEAVLDPSTSCWSENEGRGRIVWPLRSELSRFGFVVAISGGSIHDLADLGADLLARFRFVPIGYDAERERGQVFVCASDAARVKASLDDVPQEIRVSGPGFCPVHWDNDSYALEAEDGQVSLISTRPKDYALQVTALLSTKADLECTVTNESGAKRSIEKRHSTDTALKSGVTRRELSKPEARAFSHAVKHESFECPVCKKEHGWNNVFCSWSETGGPGFATPIYKLDRDRKGPVVFSPDAGGRVFSEQHATQGVQVDATRVVLGASRSISVFNWTHGSQSWQEAKQHPGPYQPVGGNRYALVNLA